MDRSNSGAIAALLSPPTPSSPPRYSTEFGATQLDGPGPPPARSTSQGPLINSDTTFGDVAPPNGGQGTASSWSADRGSGAETGPPNAASIGPNESPANEHDDQTPDDAASESSDASLLPADLVFYTHQMVLILIPVLFCIVLSILWTKLARSPDAGGYAPQSYNYVGGGTSDGSSSGNALEGLGNAMIILSQIIVATIIILILFKYNCMKVLFGFFGLVVLVLLGLFGYLLLAALLTRLQIPMDYVTFAFGIWNLASVGLVSIFFKGPLYIQQAYLVLMSSLMAFSFTGLDEWTTWLLLGLLAVWDLVAVLAPWGPLRLLIESSRQNQREIPALLYTAAVWFMASMEGSNGSPQRAASSSSNVEPAPEPATLEPPNEAKAPTNVPSEQGPEWADLVKPPLVPVARGRGQPDSPSNSNPDLAQFGMDSSTHMPLSSIREAPLGTADAPSEADGAEDTQSTAPLRPRAHPLEGVLSRDEIDGRAPPGEALPAYRQEEREPEEEDEDDAARSGLKLGLGDFVFYSVMVSRAAMRDWVTTICVSLSAIAGLVSTIFLLVLFRKALPALPISIAFGITFYFASTAIIVPWVLEGLYGGIPWNAGMVQGLRGTWQEGGQQSLYAGSWTGGVVYT